MSRINKTTYILAMLVTSHAGAEIATGKELSEVFCGFSEKLSPKSLYVYTFKRLNNLFIHNVIRDWGWEHEANDEPDATAINSYGDPVYIYKL